jgi:hypothetical protein
MELETLNAVAWFVPMIIAAAKQAGQNRQQAQASQDALYAQDNPATQWSKFNNTDWTQYGV